MDFWHDVSISRGMTRVTRAPPLGGRPRISSFSRHISNSMMMLFLSISGAEEMILSDGELLSFQCCCW